MHQAFRTPLAVLAVCIAACACAKKPAPSGPPAVGAARPAVAAAAAALPDAVTVTDAQARSLLQAWLDSQNNGQFDAHGLLYARRMTAIRQQGEMVRHYDRAAWLAERRRLFAKAMRVEVRDVQIALSAHTAQLGFEQEFSSGTLRDKGRKRMVLVREGAALRIAREEVLPAHVVPGLALPAAPTAEQLALAVHTGDETWLLVEGASAATPTSAEPLLLAQGPEAVAIRPSSAPPPPWRQRDVVLYGQIGEVCRGTIDSAAMLARIRPHASQLQAWRGEGEGALPRPAAAAIAREIFDQAAQTARAAVRVRRWQGDCQHAVWGRASNLPPARIFERGIAPGGYIREDPLMAMRALPSYIAVQQDFAQRVPPPRPAYWDQLDHTKAQVHVFAGHGRRYALVHGRVGDRCSGFSAEQMALFGVQEPQRDKLRLQLISDEGGALLQLPACAADVDGDGEPEFIGPTQVWRRVGPVWRPALTIPIPDFDSPC